ncbi:MAG TPA: farnesyl diphosphate synthase [Pyrinomonadaceae bacterium]|jgi:geranylgeranyl pyrophosphate synthase|nr:farnesyl diphosphate synthase [Pyrinomonadaceae bacterium]
MKTGSEALVHNTLELDGLLAASRALVEVELNSILPPVGAAPEKVHQAIRWSVFAGGKRFRPALLLAAGQAFGAEIKRLIRTACAFEMIHTYSLIHDDLPAMDDDDLRRGRPTCHVRFDEATAILAGDALQTLAFQAIANDDGLDAATRVTLISELTRAAATPDGMVAGQALDMEAEARQVNGVQLEEIHRLKTGALITSAARCGAIIGTADEHELAVVTTYGAQLGLLFQITDDLLDVTASAEQLGKTPGKDVRSRKATYPALYGIEESREKAVKAHRAACTALDQLNRPTEVLHRIVDFILHRTG